MKTIKLIKQAKFVPALKAGKPVPVRVRLPINFKLE
ncbi:energy transducer TonB [bacterium]|nr:energy transducer TonB [bacterium]